MNGNDYTQTIFKLFNVTFKRVFASALIFLHFIRYLPIRVEAIQMCEEWILDLFKAEVIFSTLAKFLQERVSP